MTKKLRKLLDDINSKKVEVRNLVDQDKLEEAENAKKELIGMQTKFDLLKDLEDNEESAEEGLTAVNAEKLLIKVGGDKKDVVKEFAEAARRGFPVNTVDPMNEGTNADGGYTVPEDIQTKINHFKDSEYSLRTLVSVEPVKTNKGARTYQTKAQASGFAKVDENGKLQQIAGPKYTRVNYNIEDYGGYMPVTNDLLKDSDANIANEIIRWIGRNSVATDNTEVLAILKGKAEASLLNLADIKKAINVTLGQAYRANVKIVTNDDGLNYLDTLLDGQNRPLLNPNPTEPNRVQLRAGATVVPIEIIPNGVLASEDVYTLTSDQSVVSGKTYYTRTGSGTSESPYVYTAVESPVQGSLNTYYEISGQKIPFIIGDLKEGVRIYDRQQTNIMASDVASVEGYNAFEQRGVLYRADIRVDYKAVDSDAWVNGYIQVSF